MVDMNREVLETDYSVCAVERERDGERSARRLAVYRAAIRPIYRPASRVAIYRQMRR